MTTNEKALLLYEEWEEELKTTLKVKVASGEGLALAYTPGVAEPCEVIAVDPEAAYRYTIKSNTIAVVPNESAVLDLGNIGPLAAMPVIKGKAALSKEFGSVNAFPVCLGTQDTQEIIGAAMRIAPASDGINLEDISTPRCFKIEETLKRRLGTPVFHDDQHGTAIVVPAGVINSLKLTGKKREDCRVVINGAGSAGIAITKPLLAYGFAHITTRGKGDILSGGADDLSWMQGRMMGMTSLDHRASTLADATKGVGIFVGVSTPGIVTQDMVASINKDVTLFAVVSPVPKIMSELARIAGARVVGTGHSDFPSQVNNVVVFPGIFRGALKGRASVIIEEMKLAAAEVTTGLVDGKDLNGGNILPKASDPRVVDMISNVVRDHIRE